MSTYEDYLRGADKDRAASPVRWKVAQLAIIAYTGDRKLIDREEVLTLLEKDEEKLLSTVERLIEDKAKHLCAEMKG
jgi:hypothetical protein